MEEQTKQLVTWELNGTVDEDLMRRLMERTVKVLARFSEEAPPEPPSRREPHAAP
jgi:hypothetical protein